MKVPERLMRALVRRVLDHQRLAIAVAVLLALPCMAVNSSLRVNNTITTWFLETDPNLKAYYDYQDVFGNDEVVVVAVRGQETVFEPKLLESLRRLGNRIEAQPHVRRVTSVATATAIEGDGDVLAVHPALPSTGPIDAAAAAEARRLLTQDPTWRQNILSEDLRTTLLIVQMARVDDIDAARTEALEQIRVALEEELGPAGVPHATGGIGVIYDALNLVTVKEGALLGALSYVIIVVAMLLILRHWKFAVLGLLVVFYTLTLTMGLYGFAGRSLNMVTIILPSLILVISIADFVHVIMHFYDAGPVPKSLEERRRAVIERCGAVALPCFYTSLTTATGFLALTTAKISLVRDLGLFGGAAAGIEWIVTMVFCPIALLHMDPIPGFRPNAPDGWMQRFLAAVCAAVMRRRALVGATALGLSVFFLAGIPRVLVDTYTLGYFGADHPVRQDHAFIERNFGHYLPIELTVRTREDGGLKDPETLRRMEEMERALLAEPEITEVMGLLDFSRRIHQVMQGGGPEAYALPRTRAEAAQELLLYEMDPDANLEQYVTRDYAFTRMSGRLEMMSVRPGKVLMERLEGRLRALGGDRAEVAFAGYLPLYVKIIDYLVQSQIESFSLAVLFIFGPMYVLFRSLRLTLISVIPNVLPIVILLGTMGWLGIPLDVATVTIAAIVLGVAVDDTIHFLHGFRHRYEAGEQPREATLGVIRSTGKAVVTTTLLLFSGFAVMTVSTIKPVAYFGILSGASLLAGMIVEFMFTPLLLIAFFPARPETDPRE